MRTMTVLLLILLTAATSWIFVVPRLLPPAMPAPVVVHSEGPTVERLERLANLVVTRIHIADVLTAEAEGASGAWLIRGDGLIAVNLARASITAKDDEAKQAVIRLPQPEVLQARVDHTRTRTWEVRKTTWVPWGGDQDKLRDSVMLQAQELVAHAAGAAENLQQARTAAETVIRSFYAEVGWQVKVTWEGPFDQEVRRDSSNH